jgi:thiamine-monophosphate kinase
MTTLGDMGEFGFIRRITENLPGAEDIVAGVGDDCAVVHMGDKLMLVTCDASLEDVHFSRSFGAPEDIGWKAMASALSDIAAMGGLPRFCVVTLALPGDLSAEVAEELYAGMRACADDAGAFIIGGDVTRSSSGVVIDVTAIGEALEGRYVLRSGARPGNVLAVTGHLGAAQAGLFALQEGLDLPDLKRAHFHPLSRAAAGKWLAHEGNATAMIDISDGLLQDAGHIMEASQCGLDIDPDAVPVAPELFAAGHHFGIEPLTIALTSGEEYELLVALPAEDAVTIVERFRSETDTPLAIIGRFTEPESGLTIAGTPADIAGFDHFREG